MTALDEYFGIPGVCYDIDGDWWHEPGSMSHDPEFDRWLRTGGPMPTGKAQRKCCGVVGVDNADRIERQEDGR